MACWLSTASWTWSDYISWVMIGHCCCSASNISCITVATLVIVVTPNQFVYDCSSFAYVAIACADMHHSYDVRVLLHLVALWAYWVVVIPELVQNVVASNLKK